MASKKPSAPRARNYGAEMAQVMPNLADLARSQQEAHVAAQKQLYDYQISRLPGDYRMMMGLQREAVDAERQQSIDFLANKGAEAQFALAKSSPDLAARLQQISRLAEATGSTPQITQELDKQALSDLRLGGTLSPEEQRSATQGARSAFAARGLALSNPAAFSEVLNRQQFGEQRLRERQGFASAREQGNRQFVQGAAQLNDAINPAMRILGMPTGAAQGMAQATGFIQNVRTPDPGSAIGAGLSYAQDLFNTNLNMQASQYNSYLNNQAALQGAGMQARASRQAGMMGLASAGIGMAGSIGGAALVAF